MIGHYLLTLTPEQEDRVLTTEMRPGGGAHCYGLASTPCLVQAATGDRVSWILSHIGKPGTWEQPYLRYDRLCQRFGCVVVNRAIRNRILMNQLRRTLKPAGLIHA